MSKKAPNNNNNSFKTVIILLAATLLGSFFYIYKMSDRSKDMIVSLREEKLNIINDLEKSQLRLNQTITSNKSLSKKLIQQQSTVKKLISDLKRKNFVNKNNISAYKKDADEIDNRTKELLDEIESYRRKIDSTNVVLRKEKTKNDTLLIANKNLEKKITNAAKLYFYNLQTAFLKTKSSGKQIETDRASKINLIAVTFMIAENEFVKPNTKDFYIQIIDTKNNILGGKKIKKFGNKTLNYSASTEIKYNSKTIKVVTEIPVSDLEEGTYFLNVFDKSKLILNSTFELQ